MSRLLKRSTEILACRLTQNEFEERAKELAGRIEGLAAERESQDFAKKEMKLRLTEMEDAITRLSRTVARRSEDREVNVELYAYDERGIASYCRMDTGEAYGERPLNPAERQLEADLDLGPAPVASTAQGSALKH